MGQITQNTRYKQGLGMCQRHREGYVEYRGWLPGPYGRDQTQLNTKILDLCPCPHPALLSPNPTEVAPESERQWACLGKDSSHQGGEEPAEQDGWSQCREVPKSEQRKKGFVGSRGRGGLESDTDQPACRWEWGLSTPCFLPWGPSCWSRSHQSALPHFHHPAALAARLQAPELLRLYN